MTRRCELAVALFLVAVIVAAYAPVTRLYFHSDDFEWLQAARDAARAPGWHLPADVNDHFRPLPELFWLLSYSGFGFDSTGYHAVSILLHLVTTLLVAVFAWRLIQRPAAPLIAGVLFGINFSHRAVPTWISSAPDLLLGLGIALAIVGFGLRETWQWLGLLGFLTAVLAKETGLMLLVILPLVSPHVFRRGWQRIAVLVVTAAVAVPHLLAFGLSAYARSRFHWAGGVVSTLLEAVAGLLVPFAAETNLGIPPWLIEPQSAIRVALGVGALVGVVALATGVVGWVRAWAWAAAVLLALVLPALSRHGLESRWLYAPWVILAPLAAAAVIALADRVEAALGWRSRSAFLVLAVGGHILVHGLALRAQVAGQVERDAFARGIVEGASNQPPPLRPGQVVEVIVPFGSELRAWPVGICLVLDRDVEVRPIDDRTEPSVGVEVLDATVRPARWRRVGRF